jgi:hypothetical protein
VPPYHAAAPRRRGREGDYLSDLGLGRLPQASFKISIVPFAVALLRCRLLIDPGRAEAAEDALLGETTLLVYACAVGGRVCGQRL